MKPEPPGSGQDSGRLKQHFPFIRSQAAIVAEMPHSIQAKTACYFVLPTYQAPKKSSRPSARAAVSTGRINKLRFSRGKAKRLTSAKHDGRYDCEGYDQDYQPPGGDRRDG